MATTMRTPSVLGGLGQGRLGGLALGLYRAVVLSAAFGLASLPALLPSVLAPSLLTTAASALLLVAVAAALSAAITAWRDDAAADHPQPWRAFWRSYRRDAVDVVRATAPGVLVIAAVVVSVASPGAGIGQLHGWALLAILAVVAMLTVRCTVIASFFAFRVRDVWRLAAFTLLRQPRATVALLALLVCGFGVLWFLPDGLLLLLGGVAARALLHSERPVLELVRTEFTEQGRAAAA